MDAKDHPVIAVLSDQKRFMVPIYQRQYAWNLKHWDNFWDDLVAKAEETLEETPKFKHYMGALIIAPGADGYVVGTTPQVQVVDGQQRLTTFQIFLAALREVGERSKFSEVKESVQNYIFNRPLSGDSEADAKFKLSPTPADKVVFHDIMSGSWSSIQKSYPDAFYKKGTLKVGAAPVAVQAFAHFIEKIEDYIKFGVYDPEEEQPDEDDEQIKQKRIHALLEALLNHLKLVVITLDEKDDAQVIFETLNSKAEPLLAMDLVRNNIFHRAAAQGEKPEALFQSKWKKFDDAFWKSDSPRAKPRRPRIDHFLSHSLTAQTGKEVSVRELYAEYRAFTRPKGVQRFATVEEELNALVQFTDTYRTLEDGVPSSALGILGAKLAVWEVATAYPLVFLIAIADVDSMTKEELYRLIYSYLVRRAVCSLTAKNLNKTFQRTAGVLLTKGVSIESFRTAFDGQTGVAVRFPSNKEFKEAIVTNQLYETILKKDRLSDILWELELKRRDKFAVGTPKPLGMSIEHILPQSWAANWLLPDNRIAPTDFVTGADTKMIADIARRRALLHTLGNLTLVTVPANSAASNSKFSNKKEWLKKSLLALNLELIENKSWSEVEIQERAVALGSLAIEIWPSIEN